MLSPSSLHIRVYDQRAIVAADAAFFSIGLTAFAGFGVRIRIVLFFTMACTIMPSPLPTKMNPDGGRPLIGRDDDYSIAWLSRHILELDREILERVAERAKWQTTLDGKFAKHKAPENRK